MKHILHGFALAISILFLATTASAATLAFNTSDSQFDAGIDNQGWYNSSTGSNDSNDNYAVSTGSGMYRNFLTFDLSSLVGTVVSATLELTRFQNSGNVTLEFHEITTAAATLNNNVGINLGIWTDLADGTLYGSFPVIAGPEADVLSFTLNAAAVADIMAASGGFFSIGGSLAATGGSGFMFYGSGGNTGGVQRLTIETSDNGAIPEPASVLLISAGLLGLAAKRKASRG